MKDCPSFYSSSLCLPVLVILVPLVLVSAAVVVLDHTPFSSSSSSSSSRWFGLSSEDRGSMELRPRLMGPHKDALVDSPSFNRSFSPIKQPEAIVAPDKEMKVAEDGKDEGTETTEKRLSRIEKLEAGLARCRASIREAAMSGNHTSPLSDPDYVPTGPIYHNAHVFHRSYLEMERVFKIFVYPEGEPPLFHDGPCKSIYSTEGRFIHEMELGDRFRTMDPHEAHVYFLPFSVAMMVSFLYKPNSLDTTEIKRTAVDYVDTVARKYPFWNRSLGADHFMLSCHDWGPITSEAIPYLYNNSIRVLCNANSSEGFNPSKDASLPEINLKTGRTEGLIGGPSASKRSILGFFAGGLHGPIRPVLLEHWKDKDQDLQIYEYLPRHVSYEKMMKSSKFCICPSGYEVASPRIVEAIYAACVPVIISESYVLPFSDVLDWSSFTVSVRVKEIPNLKKILMGISQSQYIRLQRRVKQVQRHFEVSSPPKRYDLFNMIVHSVWLRRLNVRVQELDKYVT
ncbi:probable glycosyltransferase At5g03795 [Aristolochia californica]|uniref:probable glycosyltransferase At5g03795 n=1 Tax=Aristolochia californica TaxID=171875 RepID=UPI0035DC00EC